MPVPHLNIRIVQRSKGSSAVAGAAYQAGEKLFSEYDQKNKDHRRKQKEVVYTEIMLPANAPPEYADRATLWNSAEEVEKQWNSQLARRFVIALPREVPLEMCPQMLKEYCEEHFVSKGMCCDKKFKARMVAIRKKTETGQMMNYSEWCSVNSYKGWLKHCDSYRLQQKYLAPIQPDADRYYLEVIKSKRKAA